jgi:ADP-heptose:LPS heptosyltransferase
MPDINPNLRRRRLPALLLTAAYPAMAAALWALRAVSGPRASSEAAGVVLFQSYQVGDFFMALPAIRRLHGGLSVTVLCRPDCLFVLRRLGIPALACELPFLSRPTPKTFFASLRQAFRLRSRLGPVALDFHADPRAAFFLKVAGVRTVCGYRRPFAWFFDRLFPLSDRAVHQSEKDMDLASSFLESQGKHASYPSSVAPAPGGSAAPGAPARGLLLSCWTRKEEKNWPLARWDETLDHLLAQGRRVTVIVPPDGGAEFRAFRARRRERVEFLEADLESVHDRAQGCEAVITLDNFLGHLGAYLGKPVFWINGSSDPAHVRPLGPRVAAVQADPMPCRPCGHRCNNPDRLKCLLELRSEAVLPRLDAWLAEGGQNPQKP